MQGPRPRGAPRRPGYIGAVDGDAAFQLVVLKNSIFESMVIHARGCRPPPPPPAPAPPPPPPPLPPPPPPRPPAGAAHAGHKRDLGLVRLDPGGPAPLGGVLSGAPIAGAAPGPGPRIHSPSAPFF